MVQILDCLAGSAFPQIVETGNEDQAAARGIQGKADIAKIRMRDVLQFRQRAGGPDTYHGPPGVKLSKESLDFGASSRLIQRHVDGGENPARERQKVRGEDHLRFAQAGMLENLGRMP